MEERNTHETILQEALTLFAARGYAAVSMRDIAAAVGIRASSIYHHFAGKQEIFDALVQQAKETKDHLRTLFLNVFEKIEKVEEDAFIKNGVSFLTGYLQNPQIGLLLQVLECERFHNKEADSAWHELLLAAPLEHETNVFRMLAERSEVKYDDAEELAAEYQSAVLLAYFTGDSERLEKQLRCFYRRTFNKK